MKKLRHRWADRFLSVLFYFERLTGFFRGGRRVVTGPDPAEVKSVILWSMDRIGDVVRSTPAIRILKKRFPDAEITAVIAGRSVQVFQNNPHITELYTVKKHYSLKEHFLALLMFRRRRWDVGVLLEADPYWGKLGQWFFRLLGVGRWVSFEFGGTVPRGASVAAIGTQGGSWIEQFNRLAFLLGAEDDGEGTEIFLTEKEEKWAEKFLLSRGIDPDKPFFLVHPGCGSLAVSRQWPPESYARLLTLVKERWPYPILLSGVKREKPIIDKIINDASVDIVNACEHMGLRELMAVTDRSSLCIVSDSGPLHIANALKVPTVAIIGPTGLEVIGTGKRTFFARLDLPCSPCAFYLDWRSCSNPVKWECLTSLTPEKVFEGVLYQMERVRGNAYK